MEEDNSRNDSAGRNETLRQPVVFREAATAAEHHTKEWIRAALREVVGCVLQSCLQEESVIDIAACHTACDLVVQAWKEHYLAGLAVANASTSAAMDDETPQQHSIVVNWMEQVLQDGRESLYMENPPRHERDLEDAAATGTTPLSRLPTVQQWTQLRDLPSSEEVNTVLDDLITRHHPSPAWCRSCIAQIPGRLLHSGTATATSASDQNQEQLLLYRKRKRSQAQRASQSRNATLKQLSQQQQDHSVRAPSPPPRVPDDMAAPLVLTPADRQDTLRRFVPDEPYQQHQVPSARLMASLAFRLGATPKQRQWRLFPKHPVAEQARTSRRVIRTLHPGTGQYWVDCNVEGYVLLTTTMTTGTTDEQQQQPPPAEQVYLFRSIQISLLDEDAANPSANEADTSANNEDGDGENEDDSDT